MAVGQFFKNMVQSFYRGGQYFTDSLSRNIDPVKARNIGRVVDAVGGGVLTYFSGAGLVSNALAVAGLVAGIAAGAAVTVPTILTVAATTLVFGTLNVMSGAFGLGLLSAARHKLGLPSPADAARRVVYETTRPLKWTAQKLRHPFKKAHDGQKVSVQPKGPGPKQGGYTI